MFYRLPMTTYVCKINLSTSPIIFTGHRVHIVIFSLSYGRAAEGKCPRILAGKPAGLARALFPTRLSHMGLFLFSIVKRGLYELLQDLCLV
jgi:hypothetical protein